MFEQRASQLHYETQQEGYSSGQTYDDQQQQQDQWQNQPPSSGFAGGQQDQWQNSQPNDRDFLAQFEERANRLHTEGPRANSPQSSSARGPARGQSNNSPPSQFEQPPMDPRQYTHPADFARMIQAREQKAMKEQPRSSDPNNTDVDGPARRSIAESQRSQNVPPRAPPQDLRSTTRPPGPPGFSSRDGPPNFSSMKQKNDMESTDSLEIPDSAPEVIGDQSDEETMAKTNDDLLPPDSGSKTTQIDDESYPDFVRIHDERRNRLHIATMDLGAEGLKADMFSDDTLSIQDSLAADEESVIKIPSSTASISESTKETKEEDSLMADHQGTNRTTNVGRKIASNATATPKRTESATLTNRKEDPAKRKEDLEGPQVPFPKRSFVKVSKTKLQIPQADIEVIPETGKKETNLSAAPDAFKETMKASNATLASPKSTDNTASNKTAFFAKQNAFSTPPTKPISTTLLTKEPRKDEKSKMPPSKSGNTPEGKRFLTVKGLKGGKKTVEQKTKIAARPQQAGDTKNVKVQSNNSTDLSPEKSRTTASDSSKGKDNDNKASSVADAVLKMLDSVKLPFTGKDEDVVGADESPDTPKKSDSIRVTDKLADRKSPTEIKKTEKDVLDTKKQVKDPVQEMKTNIQTEKESVEEITQEFEQQVDSRAKEEGENKILQATTKAEELETKGEDEPDFLSQIEARRNKLHILSMDLHHRKNPSASNPAKAATTPFGTNRTVVNEKLGQDPQQEQSTPPSPVSPATSSRLFKKKKKIEEGKDFKSMFDNNNGLPGQSNKVHRVKHVPRAAAVSSNSNNNNSRANITKAQPSSTHELKSDFISNFDHRREKLNRNSTSFHDQQ